MPCLAIPVQRCIETNTLESGVPGLNRESQGSRYYSKENSVLWMQPLDAAIGYSISATGLHTQALADGRDRARLVEGIEMQTRRAALQKTIA